MPNLKRPQHPNQKRSADRSSQPSQLPSAPLAQIVQQRQKAESAVASEAALVQHTALEDVRSLASSAHQSAQELAYQKALIIQSYPGLVDQYTSQYLQEFKTLESRGKAGFTSGAAFEQWVDELTALTLTPFSPVAALKGLSPYDFPV